MATFVLVHGGWGGGWEWTPVAQRLRSLGHDVFTPTLTGMGERAHIATDHVVGHDTHVEDIIAVLEFEDLHEVVLCGASYGGVPLTGAADRVPERIALVVYIDALVPRDGESALDLVPPGFADDVRAQVAEHGEHWRVPLPPALAEALVPPGSLPDDVRSHYLARIRPQPAASFSQPVRLTGAIDRLPRAFIRCTTAGFADELGGDPIAPGAARARSEGWTYRELAAPHDPQLYEPDATAALLDELVP